MSAIVCAWSKKWVVIGADSRLTVVKRGPGGEYRWFSDREEKVFVTRSGRVALGYAGPAVINGIPTSFTIRDVLRARLIDEQQPADALRLLKRMFLKDSEHDDCLPRGLFLIAGGFVDEKPCCSYLHNSDLTIPNIKRGFAANQPRVESRRWILQHSRQELAKFVERHVRSQHDVFSCGVTGGPTDILALSIHGYIWISRKSSPIIARTQSELFEQVCTNPMACFTADGNEEFGG